VLAVLAAELDIPLGRALSLSVIITRGVSGLAS
jgi:hypothetical protein